MTNDLTSDEALKWTIELRSSSFEPCFMQFRRMPACPGGFLMGSRGVRASEEPIHRVVISTDFWMAETPVTQAQFDCWPGVQAREADHYNAGKPDHPAENLNWYDAVAYCNWLTNSFRHYFPRGFQFASLPYEAQWEYACRGDASGSAPRSEFHTGDGEAALIDAGWCDCNSGATTKAVAMKSPNEFGLCDMHGNVWEWCLDTWDEMAYRSRWDGISESETFLLAKNSGNTGFRLLRGGSFRGKADRCRSAFRNGNGVGHRSRVNGFRVCLVCNPQVEPESV